MECPFCGGQMKEGQVFCEHCGKEMQFVPVFEPEIEESIRESLSGLIDRVEEDSEGSQEKDEEKQEEEQNSKTEKKGLVVRISQSKHAKAIFAGLGIGGVLLFLCLIFGIPYAINYNSYEYQIKKAGTAYAMDSPEGYETAVKYAKRAIEIAPNSSDAKMLLSSAYLKLEQQAEAVKMLEEIVKADHSYIEAYKSLIRIYEEQKRYEDINRILKVCTDFSVVEQFQEYVVQTPEFSEEEGEYDAVVSLKLLAGSNCTIYYTLDGSVPTESSEIYSVPIRLENGEYQVSALCVNQYNLVSDVVQKKYTIDISIPDEPEISVDSGEYTSPRMIASDLIEGYEMFYTMDGSTPTRDSIPYLVPIPMPLGNSVFQFIMYDENGVASEIARREYHLVLNAAVTVDEAYIILKQALIGRGDILDIQGHMPNMEGTKEYVCDSAFTENDQIFYLIIEYYVEPGGSRSKSGNVFAVNVHTRELYRTSANYMGYYMVEAF
ncbi:MAG: tetratricopeptide repeat protein [Lachnospiraceae bacterium]|nr:tetratricopeptide repeat protein [Lachnospiraceae bacterium]